MEKTMRIVVLGAGYGGIEAAKQLRRHYRKQPEVKITIVDRNPYHTLMTELHEIAGSRTGPEAVQINLHKIFHDLGVEVLVTQVEGIDFKAKTLDSGLGPIPYDYLVLGTGGSPEFFGTPGVQEYAYTLWSLEDAIRIRENVEMRFRDAAKESDSKARKALLTFAVAGAGFTGIELAGELLDRADVLCPQYHIERSEVHIMIIEARDAVLPILSPSLQAKASRYLAKRGAEVMVNAPIVKAEAGRIHLGDGRLIEAATFIWTCGIQGGEFTGRIALEKGKVSNDRCSIASPEGIHGMAGCHFDEDERTIVGERGRILVNDFLQSPDYPEVFMVGDIIWYLHDGKVVPQIVETAIQSGHLVARNIVAHAAGKELEPFRPAYHGFMVSIGAKYAVAELMGMGLSGFIAMGFKHLINLHYLFGVAGFNTCWAYIQHEFTNIADRRSFTLGMLSAKVPAYWTVPARLWLGFAWIVESLNKIGSGWLDFNQGSKTADLFSPGVVQATITVLPDAASAASEVVKEPEAFYGLINLATPIIPKETGIPELFRKIFMDPVGPYLPYEIMQSMVVGVEMAIGLAILGGCFTFGASGLSIVMCMVFILSGMFEWQQLWFIFLALVMMGGAGHSFGLDHWLMPWLKKGWNSTLLARRSRIYDGEPRFGRKNRRA